MNAHQSHDTAAISAQARLHHAYLMGLQLTVATRHPGEVLEDWMFRLFRRQHELKFLSSFDKLGLRGLPDAVACARYHVLSNSVGGVPVEYMEEGERKAWVRFRYPRWMYDGPTLCGVPVGVSRGFLRGWYAHNGVSLGNPRLGFVCVSEDMTGEFGFCGYFREYDEAIDESQRLRFARDELPPPFDPSEQLELPADQWSAERLQKANRNYAVEYIRNGLAALRQVLGADAAAGLGQHAARLIGLQYYRETAAAVDAVDGDAGDAARYLTSMFSGMGDEVTQAAAGAPGEAIIEHRNMRILRGIDDARDKALLLGCWAELWRGAVRSHREMLTLDMQPLGADGARWTVRSLRC